MWEGAPARDGDDAVFQKKRIIVRRGQVRLKICRSQLAGDGLRSSPTHHAQQCGRERRLALPREEPADQAELEPTPLVV